MDDELRRLRIDYDGGGLAAIELGDDPMRCFDGWLRDAMRAPQVAEANAMSLATSAPDGTPSVRMVLLKDTDPTTAGFTFFTSLEGRKARELRATGRAALCWWWPGSPGRQVRAVGTVRELPRDDVERYFASRPAAARVGAAASRQSRAIASRGELDARAAALGPDAELPDAWGGFELRADELEFWQGRPGRLHDRIAFLRIDDEGIPLATSALDAAGGLDAVRAASTRVRDLAGGAWLRVRLEP